MQNLVHEPTSAFWDKSQVSDDGASTSELQKRKDAHKKRLYTFYPFTDHKRQYVQRSRNGATDRAPAHLRTFLVSRPYRSTLMQDEIEAYKKRCQEHSMQLAYQGILFRNQPAWLIVIAEKDVDLPAAFEFAQLLPRS